MALFDLVYLAGRLIRKRDDRQVTFLDHADPVLFDYETQSGTGTALTVPVPADRYLLVAAVAAAAGEVDENAVCELRVDGVPKYRFTTGQNEPMPVPVLVDPGETVTVEVTDTKPAQVNTGVWVAGLWGRILSDI